MQTNIELKGLLSAKETARFLGISERTLWSITAPRGTLVCCKINSLVKYSPQAIERFIEQQERADN